MISPEVCETINPRQLWDQFIQEGNKKSYGAVLTSVTCLAGIITVVAIATTAMFKNSSYEFKLAFLTVLWPASVLLWITAYIIRFTAAGKRRARWIVTILSAIILSLPFQMVSNLFYKTGVVEHANIAELCRIAGNSSASNMDSPCLDAGKSTLTQAYLFWCFSVWIVFTMIIVLGFNLCFKQALIVVCSSGTVGLYLGCNFCVNGLGRSWGFVILDLFITWVPGLYLVLRVPFKNERVEFEIFVSRYQVSKYVVKQQREIEEQQSEIQLEREKLEKAERENSNMRDRLNPVKRLTARPPRSFTPDDFDNVIATEGEAKAGHLLLNMCEHWVFASPITVQKWDYFKNNVAPLAIWDAPNNMFKLLKEAAVRCREPLNAHLRVIIRDLANDGGDGEWLCKILESIRGEDGVNEVAGSWFPPRYLEAIQNCDEQTKDKYDTDALPVLLRFHADHTYDAFGDALDAALPSTAFREQTQSHAGRRTSIGAMEAATGDGLMVRYTRDKCVKKVPRMSVKVKLAQEESAAGHPRIETIGDSLRASICAKSASGLRAAWESICLAKHWDVFLVAASDLDSDDAQQPPCLHANLLFRGGKLGTIVVEVQIHLFTIMRVKMESHKLYRIERAECMDDIRMS